MTETPGPALQRLVSWEDTYAALVDTDGRPLLENKARPALVAAAAQRMAPCPYAGARRDSGKPMNVAALAPMARDFDEVLGLTIAARDAFRPGARLLTLGELYRVSFVFKAWPMFLVDPVNGERGVDVCLPRRVAVAFKVHVGLLAGVRTLIRHFVLSRGSVVAVDAPLLGELLEASQSLVGRNEVCAAPPPMLARFLVAVCRGRQADDSATRAALPARLLSYAACWRDAEALVSLLDLARYGALSTVGSTGPRQPQRLRALLPLDGPDDAEAAVATLVSTMDSVPDANRLAGDVVALLKRDLAGQPAGVELHRALEARLVDALRVVDERFRAAFGHPRTSPVTVPQNRDVPRA